MVPQILPSLELLSETTTSMVSQLKQELPSLSTQLETSTLRHISSNLMSLDLKDGLMEKLIIYLHMLF